MNQQVPSIGRIVHYVAHGTPGGEYPAGAHRAAIITTVKDDETVGLCILNPLRLFFATDVPYSAAFEPGTYHWPEYVPAVEVVD